MVSGAVLQLCILSIITVNKQIKAEVFLLSNEDHASENKISYDSVDKNYENGEEYTTIIKNDERKNSLDKSLAEFSGEDNNLESNKNPSLVSNEIFSSQEPFETDIIEESSLNYETDEDNNNTDARRTQTTIPEVHDFLKYNYRDKSILRGQIKRNRLKRKRYEDNWNHPDVNRKMYKRPDRQQRWQQRDEIHKDTLKIKKSAPAYTKTTDNVKHDKKYLHRLPFYVSTQTTQETPLLKQCLMEHGEGRKRHDLNSTINRLASAKLLDVLTDKVANHMLKKLQKTVSTRTWGSSKTKYHTKGLQSAKTNTFLRAIVNNTDLDSNNVERILRMYVNETYLQSGNKTVTSKKSNKTSSMIGGMTKEKAKNGNSFLKSLNYNSKTGGDVVKKSDTVEQINVIFVPEHDGRRYRDTETVYLY